MSDIIQGPPPEWERKILEEMGELKGFMAQIFQPSVKFDEGEPLTIELYMKFMHQAWVELTHLTLVRLHELGLLKED